MPPTGTRTVSETATSLAGSASGFRGTMEGEGDNGKGLSVLENRRAAGEDLNKNSSAEECPLLPADVLPPSPCLSFGWGGSSSLLYPARTSPSSHSAQAEP